MKGFLSTFQIVTASVIGATALVAYVYRKTLSRLVTVHTLFDEKRIVWNFRNTTKLGFPYAEIKRSGKVARFQERKKQVTLPKTFKFKDKIFEMEKYLRDHWTTGLVVLKRHENDNAELLFEKYYRGNDRDSKCVSWSMCKSVVSACIGVAVDKYMLNIEKMTKDYVPALKKSGYANVKVKDLLQMSSGIRFDEDYFNPLSDINIMGYTVALGWSMDGFVAKMKNERKPGMYNQYVSMDTQVLKMILEHVSGMPFSSFLEKHIWNKIGFESDATILMDNERDRAELAFGILAMTTRDYARFGWMYLNQGVSPVDSNVQIISKNYIRDSLTADAPHLQPGPTGLSDYPSFGYGYQWWLLPEEDDENKLASDFMAIGVYNQFIYVSPEHNIVIAKNSAYPHYDSQQDPKTHENFSETEACALFRAIAKHVSLECDE